ncbi:MAG: maltose acetyltransferase domain-containing protein [Pseudomonadota bacterium]
MSELEKMMAGEAFDGASEEVEQIRNQAAKTLQQLNQCLDDTQKPALMEALFARVGESMVQAPFHCEFGNACFGAFRTDISV